MAKDVASFYSGKSVLITGATGFLGKVLIEKLLRSCPDIKTIYIIVRSKGDKSPQDRVSDLTNSIAFDNIREDSQLFNKIIAISGDITLAKLGVDINQTPMLKDVTVVFHCAADVKFETPLKKSLEMNLDGTKEVVLLCRDIGNPVLVYVSSAYATCNRLGHRHEIIYEPKYSEEIVKKLAETDDPKLKDPEFTDGHPNWYTLSKAMAESYLQSISETLPIVIVRPSQVTPSLREPYPGWIDNIGGPTAVIAVIGKGVCRTLCCDRDCISDFIPVDMSVQLMIAAAYDMSKNRTGLKIYNSTTSGENPMTLGMVQDILCNKLWRENPLLGAVMPPHVNFRKSKYVAQFESIFVHYIPAYILDIGLRLAGHRPMLVRTHQKLDRAAKFVRFFAVHEWKYHATNTIKLYESLSEGDQKSFMFDPRKIDWKTYYANYTLGVRHFVFKEKPESLEKARKRINRIATIFQVVQVVFVSFALYALGKMFL